eukprot:12996-Heterococcus_DN1.PRE.3
MFHKKKVDPKEAARCVFRTMRRTLRAALTSLLSRKQQRINLYGIVIPLQYRDAKRAVRTGERDMEKELRNIERQEKQLIMDIKKAIVALATTIQLTAKTGNESATRAMAKQLVGLRAQRDKLYTMKANITAVGYQ